MLLGVQADLPMWRWLRGQAGFSHPKGWTQLPVARFSSGDRRGSVVWLWDHWLDPMLVLNLVVWGQILENRSRVLMGILGLGPVPTYDSGPSTYMCAWRYVPKVCHTMHFCPEAPSKFRRSHGPCTFLLIWRVCAKVRGRISLGNAGPFLQCGSGGPLQEAMWARSLGNDCRHKTC